jgi:hypothetical protein
VLARTGTQPLEPHLQLLIFLGFPFEELEDITGINRLHHGPNQGKNDCTILSPEVVNGYNIQIRKTFTSKTLQSKKSDCRVFLKVNHRFMSIVRTFLVKSFLSENDIKALTVLIIKEVLKQFV